MDNDNAISHLRWVLADHDRRGWPGRNALYTAMDVSLARVLLAILDGELVPTRPAMCQCPCVCSMQATTTANLLGSEVKMCRGCADHANEPIKAPPKECDATTTCGESSPKNASLGAEDKRQADVPTGCAGPRGSE